MASEPQWKLHVGKVTATVDLVGFDMQPEEVSSLLGLQPSFAQNTPIPAAFTPDGLVGGRDYGKWSYESTTHVSSRDVNDHLRYLLGLFVPLKRRIERLRPIPAICVRVQYESLIAGSGAAPVIDYDSIAGLAQLGASLILEVIKINEVQNA